MKKETAAKKKKDVINYKIKETVTLETYTIKMLISTGPYSNIQPEITVQANTLDAAYGSVKEHIDMLHKTYFNILEKKPEPKAPVTQIASAPVAKIIGDQEVGYKEIIEGETVAFTAAKTMVLKAVTIDALNYIVERINGSEKLTAEEKSVLVELSEVQKGEIKSV